jgi:hypothetical protein
MCRFLYRHRLATTLQLANAFFTANEERHRKNTAKNHLNHLINVGLVQRLDGDGRHHNRAFYTLTDAGVFCCQAEEKMGGCNVKRIKTLRASELLDSQKWKHHSYIVDVMASFSAAERRGDGTLLDYRGDGDTRFAFPFLGSTRRLQPDSMFTWSSGGKAYTAFLELENRHASFADVENKIRKYVMMESAGSSRGDYFRKTLGVNQFPPVLIVVVHSNELPGMRQAVLRGVLGASCGTLQDLAKRVVIGLAALDDVVDIGAQGECWECPLQGTGRLHTLDEVFGLC